MSKPHLIVAGGGLVARASAWRAAQAGFRVSLFYDTKPQASAAAAGMLAPSFEAQHYRAPANTKGRLEAALGRWDAFAAEISSDPETALDYRRDGIIGLGEKFGAGTIGKPFAVPVGFSSEKASLVETEGQVDPRRVLTALAEASAGTGVSTIAGPIVRIHQFQADAVVAELADGQCYSADAVLVAAGWASSALAADVEPLVAVRGRAFRVRLRADHRASFPDRVVRTEQVYFCPKADGTIYVGATEEPCDADLPFPVEDLWQCAEGVFPALGSAERLGIYDGLRPATPSGEPIIGPAPTQDRVFYAFGHDRNGVLLLPWTADKVVADLCTRFGVNL